MRKLFVIADDLSGATDVGAQFARWGVAVLVMAETAGDECRHFGLAALFENNEVLIVNTESRHLSSGQASKRVASVVREARAAGVEFFYKKIDSTLRGNIGAELEALLTESGQPRLYLIPANPQLGRVTRNGVCYVHHQVLHESNFANDTRSPITESSIISILALQTSTPVTLVRQSELLAFDPGLSGGIVLFDAESWEHLEAINEIIKADDGIQNMAGSAAFAGSLAKQMAKPSNGLVGGPKQLIQVPLLVVSGSLNEIALRQCHEARMNGFADIQIPPEVALRDDGWKSVSAIKIIEKTWTQLARGCHVILSSVHHREECRAFESLAAAMNLTREQQHERVARNTGLLVAQILSSNKPAAVCPGLVVFGGDTLQGIARAMNWKAFIPQDEILPGVAIFKTMEPPQFLVMSKPGGFGPQNLLDQLLRALQSGVQLQNEKVLP